MWKNDSRECLFQACEELQSGRIPIDACADPDSLPAVADFNGEGKPDIMAQTFPCGATGPYMTQSFTPSHRWVLVRNPRFHQWSDHAQPGGYPSRIILRLDIPPGPAVTAVEHNRADVLLSPPPASIYQLATSFASRRHQSKLANGSASRRHPEPVSMKASLGRLIHTSVTSGLPNKGSRGRNVRRRAETSTEGAAL